MSIHWRHRSKNAPVNLARLRVTKVRRFQQPRTADFGKSTLTTAPTEPFKLWPANLHLGTIIKTFSDQHIFSYLFLEIISAMNFSADPCENFYNYACGGWERDNDIPDTESSWGQFDILNLANDNVLKKLVKDPKTKLIYKDVSGYCIWIFFSLTYLCLTKSQGQGLIKNHQ
jgi:hypothetical protein